MSIYWVPVIEVSPLLFPYSLIVTFSKSAPGNSPPEIDIKSSKVTAPMIG